ncbi:MAG: tetratricopeptide repeat protein [Planctomycetaceae bacterium]|nr:tetratricopeptide repeat protein [Planctomycetaceae bacterium]
MADEPANDAEATAEPATGGSKKKLIIIVALLAVVGGGGAFFVLSGDPETPADKLAKALELIDKRETNWQIRQAMEIVEELDELKYVDPDFPAGQHYIRGLASFYDGREFTGKEQQERYLKAIENFEYAAPRAMPDERRGEMMWALGVALQTVSLPTKAREILEESLTTYPEGSVEASILLMENYLDLQTEQSLADALALSDQLPARGSMTDEQAAHAALLRTDILEKQGKTDEATETLSNVASATSVEHERIISLARIAMSQAETLSKNGSTNEANQKYSEAQTLLKPLIADNNYTMYASQASFLNALSAERMGTTESAINYYQRTARKFAETDEWLASQLRMASLLRAAGRDEEAIAAYRQVLRAVVRPQDFRNRWLTINQFRDNILLAWSDWVEKKKFERALALTRVMSPLIERVRALELSAQTSRQWALSVQTKVDVATFKAKQELLPESLKLWIESGKSHAALANATRTEAGYPDTVWTSAEDFARGYAFEEAVTQVDEFIRSEPAQGVPKAYVFRGRMLMNLNRLSEAFEAFRSVELNSPTDPSVFEATYRLGLCQLERNRPDDAERIWRAMLTSDELEPDANEWRLAKFALGQLQARQASNEFRKSVPADGAELSKEQLEQRQKAYAQWKEAIRHLDEYLERYPDTEERIPARYLLAKSLQSSATEIREKLTDSMPVNARKELFLELSHTLNRAGDEFRALQQTLQALQVTGMLDDYGQEMYRTTFMAIPETQFEQERYADALVGFRMVTSRFADHVSVLPAYVQMSRCYSRLEQPDEARRQLEQARVVLGRLPDAAFDSPSTGQSREQWGEWIEWARQVHDRQFPQLSDAS